MLRTLLLLLLISSTLCAQPNYTPTYPELIELYRSLAQEYPGTLRLVEAGPSDSHLPIYAAVISPDGRFEPEAARSQGRAVCMIINAIHAGEPCGVNASLQFAREKAATPDPNVTYVIIPAYNVGGMLNRGRSSRANQNGPDAYGFRGNARNLDLNRDFIKADALNTLTFYRIFHAWKPEVLIDTHTSNGADYQPDMTLLAINPAKLQPLQAAFFSKEMLPWLYSAMDSLKHPMVPYVNTLREVPDYGIAAFDVLPRYSTGYAALFNTISFTTEAHMLKPFDQRVAATYAFLRSMSQFANSRHSLLVQLKQTADQQCAQLKTATLSYRLTDLPDSIYFPGYAYDSVTSSLSGLPQLRYDRNRPYVKNIAYFHDFLPEEQVQLPRYYVIPQAWKKVKELLQLQGIAFSTFEKDTLVQLTAAHIDTFTTLPFPFESHYLHRNTRVVQRPATVQVYRGDLLIPASQAAAKYLAQVFHPQATDSYFNWNFFDSHLFQKEHYSPYVFDTTAATIVDRNPAIREALLRSRKDPEVAASAVLQLDLVYRLSPYMEPEYMRMPVYLLE